MLILEYFVLRMYIEPKVIYDSQATYICFHYFSLLGFFKTYKAAISRHIWSFNLI